MFSRFYERQKENISLWSCFINAKKVVFAIGAHVGCMFIFYSVYTKPENFSYEFVIRQNTFLMAIYLLLSSFLRESSDLVMMLPL